MPKSVQHKPASVQERITALRAELHALYEKAERRRSTVGRIDEIAREIAEIQEGQDDRRD